MAIWGGDTVSREQYDDMRHQRDAALSRAAIADDRLVEMVREVLAVKRHDLGMIPSGFDAAAASPDSMLGPMTLMAVDAFAAGYPDLRQQLIGTAINEMAVKRAQGMDTASADEEVAGLIRRGDT